MHDHFRPWLLNTNVCYLHQGKPLHDPIVTVTVTGTELSLPCFPGRCQGLTIATTNSSLDVTLTSSVTSRPEVSFHLNGRWLPPNSCSPGGCPRELQCSLLAVLTFHMDEPSPEALRLRIVYEDLLAWSYTIPIGKKCGFNRVLLSYKVLSRIPGVLRLRVTYKDQPAWTYTSPIGKTLS
jgi:hypothetical protein